MRTSKQIFQTSSEHFLERMTRRMKRGVGIPDKRRLCANPCGNELGGPCGKVDWGQGEMERWRRGELGKEGEGGREEDR